ncbi:MAG: hypothetical protein WDN27_01250 [Candidatus Saccharibacteria bacterium]
MVNIVHWALTPMPYESSRVKLASSKDLSPPGVKLGIVHRGASGKIPGLERVDERVAGKRRIADREDVYGSDGRLATYVGNTPVVVPAVVRGRLFIPQLTVPIPTGNEISRRCSAAADEAAGRVTAASVGAVPVWLQAAVTIATTISLVWSISGGTGTANER